MLEELRAWLNGTRDYLSGVLLYNKAGDNTALKCLFAKGKTDYCYKRLQSELMVICLKLKSEINGLTDNENTNPAATKERRTSQEKVRNRPEQTAHPKANLPGTAEAATEKTNPELYAASKLEADKVYKETMNARAVLFSMVPAGVYEDPNRADLVEARRLLCLKVVEGYKHSSKLYDRADHVKKNGVLPGGPAADDDIDKVPDHLVKSKLDNARKNYNKIKGREQTADRIALLQHHKSIIEKLEARWLSLKPTK